MVMIKQILNKNLIFLIFFTLSGFWGFTQNNNFSYLKAKAEYEYKNMDIALKNINNAIGIDKNNYKNYILRGKIYIEQNKLDLAINDFNKANKLKPNSAFFYLAQAYSKKHDYKNTDKYLRLYLKQQNKLPKSQVFLCKNLKEFSKTKYWKEIWKNDWYSKKDIFYQTINYLISNQNYTEALEQLDKQINQKKRYKDLYYKSLILYKLNDYKTSLKNINTAIKLSRKEELYVLRGKIFLKLKKPKRAVNDFLYAYKKNSYNAKTLFLLSQAYYQAKKYTDAATTIDEYIKYYYKNDTAYGLAGDIYYKKEEFFKSIIYYNKAIELNVKNGSYYEGRGKDFFITQSYKFAIKDFSVALDINPKNGEIYYLRGISYLNTYDLKNACSDWKSAMDYKYTDAYEYIRLNCQ